MRKKKIIKSETILNCVVRCLRTKNSASLHSFRGFRIKFLREIKKGAYYYAIRPFLFFKLKPTHRSFIAYYIHLQHKSPIFHHHYALASLFSYSSSQFSSLYFFNISAYFLVSFPKYEKYFAHFHCAFLCHCYHYC